MRKLATILISFVVSLSVLPGCGPVASYSAITGQQNAERAVAAFHESFNQGRFAEIYAATDPEFKATPQAKDFVAILEAVHRKLGAVQNSTSAGSQIRTFNTQVSVGLTHQTKFAEGDALESFNFRISGDKAVLVGYNINSVALILK